MAGRENGYSPSSTSSPPREHLVGMLAKVDLVSLRPLRRRSPATRSRAASDLARPTLAPRRPIRAHEKLDPFPSRTARLASPLERSTFVVRQTRIGHPDDDQRPAKPQDIDLSPLPLRSDALSAAHAFLRADELIQRFTAYGLSIDDYFKRAEAADRAAPPRADPGRARRQHRQCQVRPERRRAPRSSREQDGQPAAAGRGELRSRQPASPRPDRNAAQSPAPAADGHRRRPPLGLARVLSRAQLRQLRQARIPLRAQRRRCPGSDRLRSRQRSAQPPLPGGPFARHITFPWVALGRRHDREATRGWACCGRRNLARLASSTAFDDRRRGYFEEQLLSSALFRFYCAIGGECTADERPPRGIRLCRLPDHAGDPGTRCDDDADPNHRRLRRRADAGRHRDQTLGCDRIVARGRDAAGAAPRRRLRPQGLALGVRAPGPLRDRECRLETVEGIGKPPKVDIYIADSRPGDGSAAPPEDGGYWPVPLQWSAAAEPWHASDAGIKLSAGAGWSSP